MVFSSRRGHLRTQKASKPLVAGGPHWGQGNLHCSPGPVAGPPENPRFQHFRLPASALGATEGSQVTVEPWPLIALLCHWDWNIGLWLSWRLGFSVVCSETQNTNCNLGSE